MLKVIKRDGREVPFSKTKIIQAILKAFEAVDGEVSDYAEEKASRIANFILHIEMKEQEKETGTQK